MPRFSIILNVYNGAAYLRQAIDSVVAQTFPDWELVVWDDQSTDASVDIIRSYDDPRIRYFYAPQHTGLGQARAQAVQHARADWLAFIDHDDVWEPLKLEQQSQAIDRHDDGRLGIVYGRTLAFNSHGRVWHYDRWHEFGMLPGGDIFEELFLSSCFIAQSAVVLRRSAVLQVGGIPRYVKCCPDYYLYLSIARNYHAAAVQEMCCWYRVHDKSMSKRSTIRMHLEVLKMLRAWEGHVTARVYRRRRQIHQTLIATEQILARGAVRRGLHRILVDGSLPYMMERPFVKAGRSLRRMLRPRTPAPPTQNGARAAASARERSGGDSSL